MMLLLCVYQAGHLVGGGGGGGDGDPLVWIIGWHPRFGSERRVGLIEKCPVSTSSSALWWWWWWGVSDRLQHFEDSVIGTDGDVYRVKPIFKHRGVLGGRAEVHQLIFRYLI